MPGGVFQGWGAAMMLEADSVLRDGTIHLRGAGMTDRDERVKFYVSLSLRSRYFRFFGGAATVVPPAGTGGLPIPERGVGN